MNGAIAQLGERYNGIVEVGGSIPPGSTIPLTPLLSTARRMLDAVSARDPSITKRDERQASVRKRADEAGSDGRVSVG